MSEDSDLLYKVPGKCAIVYLFRDCYQCFEGEGTVSYLVLFRLLLFQPFKQSLFGLFYVLCIRSIPQSPPTLHPRNDVLVQ